MKMKEIGAGVMCNRPHQLGEATARGLKARTLAALVMISDIEGQDLDLDLGDGEVIPQPPTAMLGDHMVLFQKEEGLEITLVETWVLETTGAPKLHTRAGVCFVLLHSV
mmetsp:Transcript_15183/g.31036  ORF Transcript_15183/g.31036 Transcript_15183/m.31036 type:complete len:109 (+) Transcript_15183:403-729(+)